MTKILLFDIENAPNLGYIWGKYEQNVLSYVHEWYLLSFSYKWLGEKKVHAYSLPDFKLYKREPMNDRELVKKLHELMSEADIIVAHNGDSFDIRKTNARMIAHGFTPPAPYKTVDTKKVARRYFMFNSNKLDDLGNYFGLGRKMDTGGFGLWQEVMAGNKKAWKKMVEYNKGDVELLERIYLHMLPWMGSHPNVNLLDESSGMCPKCGSDKVQKRGFSFAITTKRQRYQCTNCGGWCVGEIIKREGITLR